MRKNPDATTDEERSRLETVGRFHTGVFINRISQGSLVSKEGLRGGWRGGWRGERSGRQDTQAQRAPIHIQDCRCSHSCQQISLPNKHTHTFTNQPSLHTCSTGYAPA